MWKRQKGFTLVEFFASMLILAVVAAYALPNMSKMLLNSRASTLGEDILYAFNFARAEAIHRSGRVSICSSNDGLSCTGEKNWQSGFMVYVDTATTDNASATSVGEVLKTWNGIYNKSSILVQRNAADVSFVRFTSAGMLARNNPDPVVSTISVTGAECDSGRLVNVNMAGQIRSSRTACP